MLPGFGDPSRNLPGVTSPMLITGAVSFAISQIQTSGGYIIKFDNDNIDEGDAVFPSSYEPKSSFVMVYPKLKDDGAEVALNWIRHWVAGLEYDLASLHRGGDTNDTSLPQLNHCIDWSSFIDYMLFTELTRNPDGESEQLDACY